MFKILLIDDEPQSVETLVEELKDKFGQETLCKVEDFNNTEALLRDFLPDLVILDVFRGEAKADGEATGGESYNFIWEHCFCPLIIYSALPQTISEQNPAHPFVNYVQKGRNSESKVVSCIQGFTPHIEALNEVQNSIRQHINQQLRDIAPLVFNQIKDTEKRKAVFSRTARRRVAAMMDKPANDKIASWEQYLYPPAGDHLLLGDIIVRNKGDKNKPNSYFIVLTPSCDLAFDKTRKPNVKKALVARCEHIGKILPEIQASTSTNINKLKEKLLPLLRKGHGTSCLPLPELPGVFPIMVAILKNLDLVELDKIGNNDKSEYQRIASVDSPFREMIMWAYIQITGRPGLPERDFDTWADKVCSAIAPQRKNGGSK